MRNLTTDENHTTVQQLFCSTGLYGIHLKIFISALNIPLCVSAFLGNILIIVAIKKILSFHPPSKLLLSCLAAADLCVGAITQPLFVIYLMTPEHSKLCFYIDVFFVSIGNIFCGVSVLTVTAISVDRLLALLLGLRYRQVVTLRRVRIIVITFWIVCTFLGVNLTYNHRISYYMAFVVFILCMVTSTFCHSKIYCTLRHRQTHVQNHVQQGQANGGAIPLNIARYRKTVSSALWLQMASLACYFPWLITNVFSQFYVPGPSLDFALSVAGTLFLLNSTLNPILYCWKMGCIRQAVKDTIRQFWCFSS
ncbi:melanocortin receptor 4-like [Orbicella faveolata]|uniref:melanocortin receptor 4-like n=1 Tax=Orbicella faveolata TaxID=48498 RepID=UPI0009E337B8|nr:melanocortin receptor 4-like [Orbicella faveolata]XP_020602080.1 melanocortin receptor 4-like [Orbicella faveolata]